MATYIFGVDHGNGNMKTCHTVFPCGLIRQTVYPAGVYDSEVIGYRDHYYLLSSTRMPLRQDKTNDLDYFVLTLFALVKEARECSIQLDGADIVLSVGLPPADYSIQEKAFVEYFKREARMGLMFTVNGAPVRCRLKDVIVSPQNFAAVMTSRSSLVKKYRTVYCVDVGDGTADLLVLRRGVPDLSVRVSLKCGIGVMRSSIINAVQQDFGYLLDDDSVEQVLMGEDTVLPENVVARIHALTSDWATKMINEFHAYIPDFRINPTIFLGGGCILLKKALEESKEFGMMEFLTDIRANAIGYQKIAEIQEAKYGESEQSKGNTHS